MFLASKRFWKTIALCLAIGVVLLLIVYAGVGIWSKSHLESRLARLQAAGEPTSIEDLETSVPADENAALILEEIRADIYAFGSAQATFDRTPEGKAFGETAYQPGRPTTAQVTMIRSILSAFPHVPVAIDKAAQCDYHAAPCDYSVDPPKFLESVLDSIPLSRGVSRYGSWQIAVAIADGHYDGAAQQGIKMLKLARLRDAEPTITNGLLSLALRGVAVRDINRVLRSGEVSPETRLLLDQELAEHDDPLWFVRVLKTERAYNLDASGDLFPHFPVTWAGRLLQADTLDMYEDLLTVLARPRYESRGELEAAFQRSYSTPISESLVMLLKPSLQAARDSFDRTVAQMRCLRVLNTLQSHNEETGREAKSLDDLDLPTTALLDPFDGKQLKLKRTGDGWVIYSVMKDGKDDGGDFEDQKDLGAAPLGYPGAD
jgi:hypothetical protein